MDFLHTLLYFIISIGILVSFHEFGHFWVARKVGVKVIRFSVGFGKILWSYRGPQADATEYVLSAIPLGGYVKMVDEREGEVNSKDLPHAFNRQSLPGRVAIVAAGPVFNLLLAVLLFWAVLVIGESGIKPIVGQISTGTLAEQAGFAEGEQIISVNGELTPTWTKAIGELIERAIDGQQQVEVKVKDADDRESVKIIDFAESDTQTPDVLYNRLGLKPWSPKLKPVIGQILPDGSAQAAGLQSGDLIVSADNEVVQEWSQWVEYVKTHADKAINLVIERDGVKQMLVVTPKSTIVDGKAEGKIGASVSVPEDLMKSMVVEYALSPWQAVPEAFATTYNYAATTLKMMAKMLVGKASVENLSGPISIAQYAGQSASLGFVHFLKFMGLVSVSLGVLNLLPIPVLDGGHLMFFGIEAIKGSPVSERIQLFFQQMGMAVLMSLMALAIFMDVGRLF